jgi:hypothetical protein
VAIGAQAGESNLGANAVAIGRLSSQVNAPANSISINASGAALNPTTASAYIKPIRQMAGPGPDAGFVQLYYNGTTGELAFL